MTQGKGKAFFDRADQVASTGNWDFAIEMYLDGISREPESVDRGHKPLRDVSLKRKQQGGKGPGMMETLKLGPGKDPVVNLRNAEFLMAKEPGSVQYMERVLQAATKLELKEVIKWICDIMLEAQKLAPKKDKRVLTVITKAYGELDEFSSAVAAGRLAVDAFPMDAALKDSLRALEAHDTIDRGGYGKKDHEFTDAVKDKGKQKELMELDRQQQSRAFLEEQIAKARKDYEATPTVPGKVHGLADALLKIEEEGYENEAIDVLDKAYRDTGTYAFRLKVGDIKMKQMKRQYAKLVAAGDRAAAKAQAQKQLEFELAEFADRAANYPTDLGIKFELGRRQLLSGKVDEALASFQTASRDPRRHVQSLVLLGQCFSRKGWFREASDSLERALQTEMTEERKKEVLYNLADVKEKMADHGGSREDLAKAQEYLSQVAQIDFNYKDVRDRIEALRTKIQSANQ